MHNIVTIFFYRQTCISYHVKLLKLGTESLFSNMDSNIESCKEKKCINKAKSYCNSQSQRAPVLSEYVKPKSFNVNEAVKSLDLALGRLKKSKLVGEHNSTPRVLSARQGIEMFMDNPNLTCNHGADNGSLMSLNFSHYELARNLSRINSNCDGACSGSTSTSDSNLPDVLVKDEHLERYFRSAEMWNTTDSGQSSVHFELPEN